MCQGGWACKQGWRADSSSKTVDKNTIRAPSLGSTVGTESLTGERKPLDHLGDIFCHWAETISGFPGGASGKEPICQYRRLKRLRFNPWVRKISWNRTWQPAPVFLPVEFHGQRSLVGYGQTWLMGLSMNSRDYFIRSHIDLSQISLKIPLPPIPCASGNNHRISFFFLVPRYQERKCERLGVGSLWSQLGKPSHNTLRDSHLAAMLFARQLNQHPRSMQDSIRTQWPRAGLGSGWLSVSRDSGTYYVRLWVNYLASLSFT